MFTIEVFIISWKGQHSNAENIANSILKKVDSERISIVYSDPDPDVILDTSCNLIKRPNELFWADKFKACIDNCQSDLMLIIHSDCTSEDWSLLVKRCQSIMSKEPGIGVWAPLIEGTPWDISWTAITNMDDTPLTIVAETDGIVFCLSKSVQKRMKQLNYDDNIYGWGIEHIFNAYSFTKNLYSVVDKSILVHHPKERGYSGKDAKKGKINFLTQMTSFEQIQHTLLISYVLNRKKQQKSIGYRIKKIINALV